ncbi:MAG: NAD(P)(+) transhydrogenase (Re/Si-specific) subunit alpha, partial [Actinomycetota bacterium]
MQHEGVTVGVPRETFPGETRVAMIPLLVPVLAKVGLEVVMESGAGAAAGHLDEAYASRGARVASREEVLAADVLLQVRTLGANPDAGRADLDALRSGQVLIGLGEPLAAAGSLAELAHRGLVVFAMELIPRIARAQSMDVLSSQSTVSGYKAVILAAERLPKLFPMLTTAAGTVAPARVFVIGAGVAGLQAIATARRLGALVEAYD